MSSVTIVGENVPGGTYLLRLEAAKEVPVRIGRFHAGKPVLIPAGTAVYVGSAMSTTGSMTLARRLLRHTTRRPPKPAHAIRPALRKALVGCGLASERMQAPSDKRLFWNIDYVLDELGIDLTHIYILRSAKRLEDEAALMLLSDRDCLPIAAGLGAHDRPQETHLLRVQAGAVWWASLPTRLQALLEAEPATQDHK